MIHTWLFKRPYPPTKVARTVVEENKNFIVYIHWVFVNKTKHPFYFLFFFNKGGYGGGQNCKTAVQYNPNVVPYCYFTCVGATTTYECYQSAEDEYFAKVLPLLLKRMCDLCLSVTAIVACLYVCECV